MPHTLRVSFAGGLFHVTTRGNNRERVFYDDGDYEKFKALLRKYREKHNFKLYAYSLMPNHVHLLIETTTTASISTIMHALNMSYAKYFNARHGRVGHVWQGRFHSSIIDSENYFLEVMRYMDLNPVRAGMCEKPDQYEWSSHRHFALGKHDDLVDSHELYDNLGEDARGRQKEYRKYVAQRLEEGTEQRWPELTRSVFVGGDDFESRMIRIYGEKIWPKYRRLLNRLYELRSAALDK